ncbi:MAG TPA: hypothetical protein EYQ74_06765 [Planctomycetes bacterium]|nr:hypothetical protein [Planctomycetota bacterium]HIK59536.1 hypothetical protein [Planctomycetota bacterium]
MSTPYQHQREARGSSEWRAALLGIVACVGLVLVQVRGSLHLVLESHCVAHEVGACGEWHGTDHGDHAEDTSIDLVHLQPAQPAPGTSDGAHCPYTLTDHPGQVSAKAPLGSNQTLLSGLAPCAFRLHTLDQPAVSGSQRPELCPPRTLLQSAVAPRGPPCIV